MPMPSDQPAPTSSPSALAFPFAYATGRDLRELVRNCLDRLGRVPVGCNLGFIYASDGLGNELAAILRLLREHSGVDTWVGSVGMGVIVTGQEIYDQPAIAVMLGDFPEESFQLIPPLYDGAESFLATHLDWLTQHPGSFAVVHGNPMYENIPGLLQTLFLSSETFYVGGITSARESNLQIANGIHDAGLSGVIFDNSIPVVTSHTQGCSPIGPRHRVTRAERNIIATLDNRPALQVFKEDIGEVLAKDLERAGGYIFVGLPIPQVDTGDYLVRNLLGIDTGRDLLAVGDYVQEGRDILFCRRDGNSAREDLQRMLHGLRTRINGKTIRGGLYFSCLGRGRNQFGEDSAELRIIQAELGDFPLVGFFANGEIFSSRIYGYTGVLTLFLGE